MLLLRQNGLDKALSLGMDLHLTFTRPGPGPELDNTHQDKNETYSRLEYPPPILSFANYK